MISMTYEGQSYTNFDGPAELLAAGVPQAAIDAHLAAERLKAVKAEAKRRIRNIVSAEAKTNMTFAVAFIGSKTAASRTAPEQVILAKAPAVLEWDTAMFAAVQTLAADFALDIYDDANWPQPAQDALDLAAMF